jgi:hypothetical protein
MGDISKKAVKWSTLGLYDPTDKKKDPPKPTLMMPDPEAVKRDARRKQSKRAGGRTSTLLSQ